MKPIRRKYQVISLSEIIDQGINVDDILSQIDSLVLSFPEELDARNDLGSADKWRRLMLHSPSTVFCLMAGEYLAGYCFFLFVNDNIYREGIIGSNINKAIDVGDIDNCFMPGKYRIYFVDLFIYKHHQNSVSNRKLYNAVTNFLRCQAKNGYFVERIFAHTGSEQSISLCENVGFHFITSHREHVMQSKCGDTIPTSVYEINLIDGSEHKLFILDRNLRLLYQKNLEASQTRNLIEDSNRVVALISAGESQYFEAKETLRINVVTSQDDGRMELAVLKSIAAFLNHTGGVLAIGVHDSGTPTGIERDGFDSVDKMVLHLLNLINGRMGKSFRPYIKPYFCDFRDKRIMVIECSQGHDPCFVSDGKVSRFFVRAGAATTELSGRDLADYLKRRFV